MPKRQSAKTKNDVCPIQLAYKFAPGFESIGTWNTGIARDSARPPRDSRSGWARRSADAPCCKRHPCSCCESWNVASITLAQSKSGMPREARLLKVYVKWNVASITSVQSKSHMDHCDAVGGRWSSSVQPHRRMQSIRSPGKPLSALSGIHLRMRSSSCWPVASALAQR